MIDRILGSALLLAVFLSLLSSFYPVFPSVLAGVPLWFSAIIFFKRVKRNQKIQVSILLGLGVTTLIAGLVRGADSSFVLKALQANYSVATMLLGVGFLRLLAASAVDGGADKPHGIKALVTTMFGNHLFGSVLNMSSVIIMGDKMAKNNRLTTVQGLTLLRAFSACAFWSPFFAAMGLTLVSAPGAQLMTLVVYGIPLSITALLITSWQLSRSQDIESQTGYPIAFQSLWLPCLLAFAVIVCHYQYTSISVLTLVTLISMGFTCLWLPLTRGRRGIHLISDHVRFGIQASGGEILLFASSALLASGFAALLATLPISLTPDVYEFKEAAITLLILIAAAMIGMHPVTSVVLAGSLLSPSATDPNLLGMTLLMGWSLGIVASPFSGVQISIQSRYQISPISLLKANSLYVPLMYMICLAIIAFYSMLH